MELKGKKLEQYLPAEEIRTCIQKMAVQMSKDLSDQDPVFLPVLNGAFLFAADLLRELNFPCECSFVKVSSYSGTQSTGAVETSIGLEEDLKGRTVVVLEDIIDTGTTLKILLKQLEEIGVEQVKVAALLFKPDAFQEDFSIDYIGKEIPNDFVVGYGMDYDGWGRNLKDIHILTVN